MKYGSTEETVRKRGREPDGSWLAFLHLAVVGSLALALGAAPAVAQEEGAGGETEEAAAETPAGEAPAEEVDHLVEPHLFPGVNVADMELTEAQRRALLDLTGSLHERFGDLLHGPEAAETVPGARRAGDRARLASAVREYRERVLEVLTPSQRERVALAQRKSLLSRSSLAEGRLQVSAANDYGLMSLFGPTDEPTLPFDDRPWETSFPVPLYTQGALSGDPPPPTLDFFTARLLLGGSGGGGEGGDSAASDGSETETGESGEEVASSGGG